jgi:hypothetical protein
MFKTAQAVGAKKVNVRLNGGRWKKNHCLGQDRFRRAVKHTTTKIKQLTANM